MSRSKPVSPSLKEGQYDASAFPKVQSYPLDGGGVTPPGFLRKNLKRDKKKGENSEFFACVISLGATTTYSSPSSFCNLHPLSFQLLISAGEGKGYHPAFCPREFHGLVSPSYLLSLDARNLKPKQTIAQHKIFVLPTCGNVPTLRTRIHTIAEVAASERKLKFSKDYWE